MTSAGSLSSSELSLTQQEELTNDVSWVNSPERLIEFKVESGVPDALRNKKPKILRGKKRPASTPKNSIAKPSDKFLALMDSMDVVEDVDADAEEETLIESSSAPSLHCDIMTSSSAQQASQSCMNISRDVDVNDSQSNHSEIGILNDSDLNDDKNDLSTQVVIIDICLSYLKYFKYKCPVV
jgi:hypothetical protein